MGKKETVFCQKFQEERAALEQAPFPNALGQEILRSISKDAWEAWLEFQLKVINEYRLDLGEQKDRERLWQEMRNFLQLEGAEGETLHVGTPTQ